VDGHRSIIIAVFSTSSGCGKTVTAINLAAGLAKEGYRVCLADLDLQFGDVMGYLDMVSDLTLADAQRALLERPDSFRVEDYLAEYNRGGIAFSVLPPPRAINEAYQVRVEAVEELLRQLEDFNFIVLDLTAIFSALNLAMLDMSTIINYIGVVNFLPAVKNYKLGYDTLRRFEYEESKICLVENRAEEDSFIPLGEVERLLGEKFLHHLPEDREAVERSIHMGRPLLMSAPLSPLTQSYWHLVGRYTGHGKSQEKAGQEKASHRRLAASWLAGLRM